MFLVAPGAPAAQAAEEIVREWAANGEGRPAALVLADEILYSRLVEHLRRRVLELAPVPLDPAEQAAALRDVLDGGDTLIAGGQACGGGILPALFVNVTAASRLVREPAVRGPFLAVARDAGAGLDAFLPAAAACRVRAVPGAEADASPRFLSSPA